MSKTKKRILIVVCLLVFIVFAIGIKFFNAIEDYPNEIAAISIENIDLEGISDGRYIGECATSIVKAEVTVDVKEHKITAIVLTKHVHGQGEPAEAIIPEVIAAQSVQVDAITGATISSKVILKAIESALNGSSK